MLKVPLILLCPTFQSRFIITVTNFQSVTVSVVCILRCLFVLVRSTGILSTKLIDPSFIAKIKKNELK